ncbi:MAG: response regulator [Rhodospirillales bacterium]|nr:response regulator [Rhodospirillales bacterium]
MARILVIDDEEIVRFTVEAILSDRGHDVVLAKNGNEGIALHNETPFDMIVTDLVMPEKEGIETIRDLRANDAGLPIIAISGGGRHGSDDYLKMALKFGAVKAIKKPFGVDDIVAAVDEVLNRQVH